VSTEAKQDPGGFRPPRGYPEAPGHLVANR